jgi:glutathione S-transferase
MLILHGISASPFVRKVLTVLHLKGLAFEQCPQMPFTQDAAYRKINPLGKIPSLQDGDFTACDSSVICEYLDEVYPDIPVYPKSATEKAHARWLEELSDNQVTEYATGIFFQRFMRPRVFNQPPDEALIEKLITDKLPPLLDYLESQVPPQNFLFGSSLGATDIAVVSPFINASYAGYLVDEEQWPGLSSFIDRVRSHPVVASLLKQEAAMLPKA